MADKKFTFRLSEALYNSLAKKAIFDGTTVSDAVRHIVLEHLRVESITSKLDELDISRRFRELYAQMRLNNHGIDALARAMLGQNYDAWISEVKSNLQDEIEKRNRGGEK